MDALASSIIYPKATKFRADSKSAKVAKKAKKPKAPKVKKETSRKRVTLKKKVPEEGPKFENPNAGTVVYELAKNALGPPSPPHDEDIPLEDLLPPDEVRIRAPHDAAVSVLNTPLVNASVSKGVFTLRVKKGKVGGAGHNEFLERLAAPRLARQKRRVERAKRALERLAELNMEQSELWIKREEEEYEGGDEDEVQSCEDSGTGQELEIVE
ncbi:hypothetical protein HYQ46_003853 [Verticillium longisporum]|nr:hypothetical protein HYQ46_003853 [Verticillium longisporum]